MGARNSKVYDKQQGDDNSKQQQQQQQQQNGTIKVHDDDDVQRDNNSKQQGDDNSKQQQQRQQGNDDDSKQQQQHQQGNGDDDSKKQQQQQCDDNDDSNDFYKTLMKVLKGYFNDYKKLSNDGCNIKHHHHHHGNGNDGPGPGPGDDNMIRVRHTPSYQLRVFVSSTFTDTHYERNILLDEIVPVLKGIAAPYGIEVVFIDMRYGVRDENTLDHMTWLACKSELSACICLLYTSPSPRDS